MAVRKARLLRDRAVDGAVGETTCEKRLRFVREKRDKPPSGAFQRKKDGVISEIRVSSVASVGRPSRG